MNDPPNAYAKRDKLEEALKTVGDDIAKYAHYPTTAAVIFQKTTLCDLRKSFTGRVFQR
jgi:hypothetical protein